MKCEVCGRTVEELREEFSSDIDIEEHQGIDKCSKCIREYKAETQGDRETEEVEDKNWKEQILA